MKKEIKIDQVDDVITIDGLNFDIVGNYRESMKLRRDDGAEMIVRKIPLFNQPERMLCKEIAFLRLDRNKKCFKPGARKNTCRVDN